MKVGHVIVATLAVAAAVPSGATAQTPGQPSPFDQVLYPPELIMQHRRAIGLTDAQRDEISGLIEDLQGRVVRLQWEILDEMESLTSTLQRPRVDLDLALDRLDDVLETEKEIKQAHMEMLIRMKNILRPEQQGQLDRLRENASRPPDDAREESS